MNKFKIVFNWVSLVFLFPLCLLIKVVEIFTDSAKASWQSSKKHFDEIKYIFTQKDYLIRRRPWTTKSLDTISVKVPEKYLRLTLTNGNDYYVNVDSVEAITEVFVAVQGKQSRSLVRLSSEEAAVEVKESPEFIAACLNDYNEFLLGGINT